MAIPEDQCDFRIGDRVVSRFGIFNEGVEYPPGTECEVIAVSLNSVTVMFPDGGMRTLYVSSFSHKPKDASVLLTEYDETMRAIEIIEEIEKNSGVLPDIA